MYKRFFASLVVTGLLFGASLNIGAATHTPDHQGIIGGEIITLGTSRKDLWFVTRTYPLSRYPIGTPANLRKTVSEFGLLVTQETFQKTPEYFNNSFFINKDERSQVWYVATDGKKYALSLDSAGVKTLQSLARKVTKDEVAKIKQSTLTVRRLKKFTSANKFDRYIAKTKQDQKKYIDDCYECGGGGGDEEMAESSADGLGGADPASSITNVQEEGVDEGGIVKVYKDYFVILRRGRLFAVRMKDGADILKAVSKVDVTPAGMKSNTWDWYDEMLISGNRIIVIGYRYSLRATEVGLFRIDNAGALSHEATYFLDSDDYYSSRNYASRLVGTQLIFYMPNYLIQDVYDQSTKAYREEIRIPKMRTWTGNQASEPTDILSKVDIYESLQADLYPILHSVITCDLANGFSCSGQSILGPASRNFYVSNNAVYLWLAQPGTFSYVYRMPLNGGSVGVLRADGAPIDQFSFQERDGNLNVFVSKDYNRYGEGMWNAEGTAGNFALLSMPLSSFSTNPALVNLSRFIALAGVFPNQTHNRFIGQHLVYGEGADYYGEAKLKQAFIHRVGQPSSQTQVLSLTHDVQRIERMDENGTIIVGKNGDALEISTIPLSVNYPALVTDTYSMPGFSQGELRSHGFFYKPQSDGTAFIGLPVRKEISGAYSLINDSASVAFLKIDAARRISKLGELASKTPPNADDGCLASCLDWYGNARPIFFAGRIFALLGYELVEGVVRNSAMTEVARVNFLQ